MSPEFSMTLCTDQKDKRLWVRDYCITGKQTLHEENQKVGKKPVTFCCSTRKVDELKRFTTISENKQNK